MLKINLKLDRLVDHPRAAERKLVLPFGERSKSRLLALLDNGEEAGLFLERGSVLRHGDLLLADDGRHGVEVRRVLVERWHDPQRRHPSLLHQRSEQHVGR